MKFSSLSWAVPTCVFATGIALAFDARVATACGGCFHPEPSTVNSGTDRTSVVTDHRMVLSISTKQTVLWDQVRYAGNPEEFAWVLPVRPGARIELARAEFIDALELATRASVQGPTRTCPSSTSNGATSSGSGASTSGGGGGGGSGSRGCGASSVSAGASSGGGVGYYGGNSSGDASPSTPPSSRDGGSGVSVVSDAVVGPYQAVTLHAAQGEALDRWLVDNHFVIPDNVAPIIASYVTAGFDFIAMRLRPGLGVRQMRPVRVVMPGAGTALPLRMVTAGIGAKVGLALWIISEGRWEASNFGNVTIDRSQIVWIGNQGRSNYRELATQAMAQQGGRVWLTESSLPQLYDLSSLYIGACQNQAPIYGPCGGYDAGLVAQGDDAGASDAGAEDGGADAEVADANDPDAVAPPPPTCPHDACDEFDDVAVASDGLHPADTWVTKIRAELTASACASGDLELKPAAQQTIVTPSFATQRYSDPTYDPCPPVVPSPASSSNTDESNSGSRGSGCACETANEPLPTVPIALGALGLLAVVRLRRARRT